MSGAEINPFDSLPLALVGGPHTFIHEGSAFVVGPTVFSPARYKSSGWFVDRLIEVSPDLKNKTMIEVGCGCGYAGQRMVSDCGLRFLHSGDINSNAVTSAIENSIRLGIAHKVSVLESDVFDGFAPGTKGDIVYWNHPWNFVRSTYRKGEIVRRGFYDPGYRGLDKYIEGHSKILNEGGRMFLGFGESGNVARLQKIACWHECEAVIAARGTVESDGSGGELYLFEIVQSKSIQAVQWPHCDKK